MQAYIVHDPNKQQDVLVVPERDRLIPVDRRVMEEFIAVQPDFSRWPGKPLNGLGPDRFGRLVATRETREDVCIVDETLWQQRMAFHLGGP